MSEWKEAAIEYKYAEIPEKPQYKKKKKKKKIKKSDHKHIYASCMYNDGFYTYRNGEIVPMLWYGTYCIICGRIGDITYNTDKLTKKLPIFEISLFKDKYIPIGDDND